MHNPAVKYLLRNQFILALFLLGVGWLFLQIKEVFVIIFTSYIIMASLLPFVEFLKKQRIPRVVAVLIAYFTTLTLLVLLIFPLIPFFSAQIQAFFVSLPFYFDQLAHILGIDVASVQIGSLVASEFQLIGSNIFVVTSKIFGGLFSVVTVFVISFYLLMDHARITQNIIDFFPKRSAATIGSVLALIEEKLGAWLRGQIVLSAFIGFVTWVALVILGLEFALPLALIAGILEIVPTIGPIISAVPALVVALTISPAKAVFVVVAYLAIQMLENNILVPKIMQKAVGLNPIVIIIGIMIGSKLMGALGALLSIPFISMLLIIFRSLRTTE